MNRTLQIFLALAFVLAFGTVLIQPVLDAADPGSVGAERKQPDDPGSPSSNEGPGDPAESPTPEPDLSPAPTTGPLEGAFRTQPLFDPYPARCLQPATSRADRLITVSDGVADPVTGFVPDDTQGRVAARTLVGLDASAETFATYVRPRDVLFSTWEGIAGGDGAASAPRGRLTAWSPVAPCGLSATTAGLRVVPTGDTLVRERVADFAFSPDGRRVALVLDEGETRSLWMARLGAARMREIHRVEAPAQIDLRAWDAAARTIYLSSGPGGALGFVTTDTPPQSAAVVPEPVRALEQCSGRLIGVVQGGIAEISRRGPEPLTPRGDGYTAVSCSPDGGFIAAVRAGSLVLLDGAGSFLRDLAPNTGYRDVYVDWGEGGAGLIFGRAPDGGKDIQVWHIPSGGSARNTGLTHARGPAKFDWSASPPTGLP